MRFSLFFSLFFFDLFPFTFIIYHWFGQRQDRGRRFLELALILSTPVSYGFFLFFVSLIPWKVIGFVWSLFEIVNLNIPWATV